MSNPDQITEFLAAVNDLRSDDDAVRTTAHTSSVSAEGWPAARPTEQAEKTSDE